VDDATLSYEDAFERLRPVFHASMPELAQQGFGGSLGAFAEGFGGTTFSNTYTYVYKSCTQKPPNNHAAALYRAIDTEFNVVAASISILHVHELGTAWLEFEQRVFMMAMLVTYIDRVYVARMSLPSLGKVGVAAFLRAVVRKLQPTRLLRPESMPLRPDFLVLRSRLNDEKEMQQAKQLRVDQLRDAVIAHGEEPSGPKYSLVRQLVDAKAAAAAAAVEAERTRVRSALHPQILASLTQQGLTQRIGVDVIEVLVDQLLDQAARVASLMERWRRGASQVGQIARFWRAIHTDVRCRPDGAEYKRARDEFYRNAVQLNDTNGMPDSDAPPAKHARGCRFESSAGRESARGSRY